MSASKRNYKKGFTLVELLVTISIFVILTGVVLFNQSKFNTTILLTNLAYDTALTIRQAQTYGINIKEFNTGAGGADASKFVPYGVHFDTTLADKSFILFADVGFTKESGVLTPFAGSVDSCQNTDSCVARYSIKRGNYISKIEYVDGLETKTATKLDIIFKRPNPDAKIFIDGNPAKTYSKAIIYLTGGDSNVRRVEVQENGLIEIKY